MVYVLIFLVIITSIAQNVCRKSFDKYCKSGINFGGISSIVACIFYAFISDFSAFSFEYIPNALLLTLSFSAGVVFMFYAFQSGSFAITSLIFSYSVVIPAGYGILFLNEKITVFKILGIILFMGSSLLVSGVQTERKDGYGKINAKWLIFVLIGFLANGFTAVFQKKQQYDFAGKYDSIGMFTALALSGIILIIIALLSDKKELRGAFTKGLPSAAVCGLCVGITNYLAIAVLLKIAASIFFPVSSVGMIVLSMALSLLIYKEKFSPMQITGMIIGIFALIFLNI